MIWVRSIILLENLQVYFGAACGAKGVSPVVEMKNIRSAPVFLVHFVTGGVVQAINLSKGFRLRWFLIKPDFRRCVINRKAPLWVLPKVDRQGYVVFDSFYSICGYYISKCF